MKTPVIFILIPIITFGWCAAYNFFLLSMVTSPFLLGSIKEADIRDHVDKLNPKCSNFTEILKEETYPKLWDCVHLNIDHNLTICEMANHVIENCTGHVDIVFENCVINDHKHWPSLVKKSLISLQQYICETRTGSLIELLNPCIWNNTEEIKEKFKKEEDVLKEKYEKYKNNLPFPKEFCDTVSSDVRKYISTRMETTCYNHETRSAILSLYDAIIAPCEHYNAVDSYRNETYTDDTEF